MSLTESAYFRQNKQIHIPMTIAEMYEASKRTGFFATRVLPLVILLNLTDSVFPVHY